MGFSPPHMVDTDPVSTTTHTGARCHVGPMQSSLVSVGLVQTSQRAQVKENRCQMAIDSSRCPQDGKVLYFRSFSSRSRLLQAILHFHRKLIPFMVNCLYMLFFINDGPASALSSSSSSSSFETQETASGLSAPAISSSTDSPPTPVSGDAHTGVMKYPTWCNMEVVPLS
ncbi:hypothetical protein NE237_005825 [Protea cynaroides]|uniref:Uncharacterized protein n=1 Tax=Protea cynaroides TaxID=273540 RepID=A0A9Q0KLZ3_9MAGN|nr:hypothetical protein NE237_005825 [Protea cynaroides]